MTRVSFFFSWRKESWWILNSGPWVIFYIEQGRQYHSCCACAWAWGPNMLFWPKAPLLSDLWMFWRDMMWWEVNGSGIKRTGVSCRLHYSLAFKTFEVEFLHLQNDYNSIYLSTSLDCWASHVITCMTAFESYLGAPSRAITTSLPTDLLIALSHNT